MESQLGSEVEKTADYRSGRRFELLKISEQFRDWIDPNKLEIIKKDK
jgi:hypothetical protein